MNTPTPHLMSPRGRKSPSSEEEEAFATSFPRPNLGSPILSHPMFKLCPELARIDATIRCSALAKNMTQYSEQRMQIAGESEDEQ